MSQPLDSQKKTSFEHSFVTPGRPPKVPFFWWERYVYMFLCQKIVPVDTLLVFQVFGVRVLAIATMLGVIKNMKFFLQTCFGKSSKFAGGGVHIARVNPGQQGISYRVGGD
jgi:hypothetical protein